MNILIPISGRSDEGLVMPIIKRLKARGHRIIEANAKNYYQDFNFYHIGEYGIDVVLICGDRVEMVWTAYECFLHHLPIAHLYAGVTNEIATFDDINRHCITLWSDVQFCENQLACFNVQVLCDAIGKIPYAHNVGITHLDDLEIDPWFGKEQTGFDLVLYNPPTLGDLEGELQELEKIINKKKENVYMVYPNQDEGRERIIEWAKERKILIFEYTRREFLGMLKTCRRFITNSSVEYYEAPHFLKPEQIVHIGKRNLNRSSKGPLATGASDKIVKILEDLYDHK